MQRMSGIATATAAMVAACTGTKAKVLETRKTVPGLRLLDKWAVLIGGGCNHRMGVYDMIMIKDNHIAAAGSLTAAVRQACKYVEQLARRVIVEVEVRTFAELDELLAAIDRGGCETVTRVMLDNMVQRERGATGGRLNRLVAPASALRLRGTGCTLQPQQSQLCCPGGTCAVCPLAACCGVVSMCALCDGHSNHASSDQTCAAGVDISQLQDAVSQVGGRLETEASGNVTQDTVGAIAQSGCDFISCGALTHSVRALDISFNIEVHATQ